MSFQEKRALVTIFTTLLIFGLYVMYLFNHYPDAISVLNNDFRFWGKAFLILIPVMVVAQIIIHIVFIIINKMVGNEDMPDFDDERDKLIELKSVRISHYLFTVGFLLAMTTQAMGKEPWVMFVTLIIGGFISSLVAEAAKIIMYRRGV